MKIASPRDDRQYGRTLAVLSAGLFLVSMALTLFHLYLGVGTAINVLQQRIIHVFGILTVWYLSRTRKSIKRGGLGPAGYYGLLTVLVIAVGTYYVAVSNPEAILERGIMGIGTADTAAGVLLILFVLLASRQTVGLPLTLIVVVFLAYALFGPYMPDVVAHKGYDVQYITSYIAWTLEGIFGTPIGASVSFVSLYIIFGELLDRFGAGKFFIDLACALTGRLRGGPAEAAVLSSAMMGSINGSAVANVVTTGTFTIPLMKRAGYKPHYAAAVEAAASTGGQILPPVMGAAAFVMADMTGIRYSDIVLAGILPGILYYWSLGLAVYLQAGAADLRMEQGSPLRRIPSVLKSGCYHLIPLAVLLFVLLGWKYSAGYAALFAIGALLLVGTVKTVSVERRFPWKELGEAAARAASTTVPVAAACAAAGIVIGIVSMTGIGIKFTRIVFDLSGNNLFLMLLMVMCACLVLGMGLPSTAAYVIAATVGAPALIKAGIPPLAANMFVFYFAVLSFITPPVAIAAYAGAGIAGADPTRTGFTAFRLGFAGMVIPFLYVYHPTLLLTDSPALSTLAVFGLALAAVMMMTAAFEGWAGTKIRLPVRIVMFVCAALLVVRRTDANLLGAAATLLTVCWLGYRWRTGRRDGTPLA